jgi:hypothetical protein
MSREKYGTPKNSRTHFSSSYTKQLPPRAYTKAACSIKGGEPYLSVLVHLTKSFFFCVSQMLSVFGVCRLSGVFSRGGVLSSSVSATFGSHLSSPACSTSTWWLCAGAYSASYSASAKHVSVHKHKGSRMATVLLDSPPVNTLTFVSCVHMRLWCVLRLLSSLSFSLFHVPMETDFPSRTFL